MTDKDYVDLIRLNRLKDTPYWKTLTCDGVEELVRDILIRFDIQLQYLGVEYDQLQKIGKWDPDAHFTPCEHQMHVMAKLFGWDYNKDIAPEAYAWIQEWEAHIKEVHKKMGVEE